MKQAQSMGVNLVIITAIALLVLIIIAIVISNSGGDLRRGLERCSVNGGICLGPGEAEQGQTLLRDEDGNTYACEEELHECYSIS